MLSAHEENRQQARHEKNACMCENGGSEAEEMTTDRQRVRASDTGKMTLRSVWVRL